MNPDKIRNILNLIFLALTVVAFILYFVADFKVFLYVCGAAIFTKIMEFFIRFTNR